MSADIITPFAFESFPVRGALIHLERSWRRMQSGHDYDDLTREVLGHAAAATTLIAQSLKFDGQITLQIHGSSMLQMLVMQCTSAMDIRGMAVTNTDEAAGSFSDLTANAHCAITVDAGERPYQGIVAIQGESLAESLEHYFDRSVQVPSIVALVSSKQVSGGLLLQQMPGQPVDDDDWNRIRFLAATLQAKDLKRDTGMDLIRKIFAEDDIRVHASRAVIFNCRCSGQKVEDILRMLGEKESRAALAEQERIEVTCEYCGRRRYFDIVDVERLFADNVVSGPDSVQ